MATFDASSIRAILLDIEGTTTPVAFVYNVLFPFARTRMRAFLEAHASAPDVRADLTALQREHAAEARAGSALASPLPPWHAAPQRVVESAAACALWLMEQDRKSTALKSLQGKIWEAGYRSGELRGEVYPDVAPALTRWKQRGLRVAIFSSGSVQAQQLLFRHSTAGDLTPHLDAYFDTTTGPKQDSQSYRRIAAALELPPQLILFLSDVTAELDAAQAAELQTGLCTRTDNPASSKGHQIVQTFEGVS